MSRRAFEEASPTRGQMRNLHFASASMGEIRLLHIRTHTQQKLWLILKEAAGIRRPGS